MQSPGDNLDRAQVIIPRSLNTSYFVMLVISIGIGRVREIGISASAFSIVPSIQNGLRQGPSA